MADIVYEVTIRHNGKPLRDILRGELNISASLLTKLKHSGGIFLNGEPATVAHSVLADDIVTLHLPQEKSESIAAIDIPLDIVYEDEYLLIINKPKDMPTIPSAGNRNNTVGNACMYYYRNTDFVFRPVNRLDRDTTGLVVIAKDARTSAVMSKQMQEGKFKKIYTAITCGVPSPRCGIIEEPIGRSDESIIKREVRSDGQYALTEYKTLAEKDGSALVQVKLHTGRTHQIRVHFAHIGTPLLYDYLYGTEIPGETLFLHCERLDFVHPMSKAAMCVTAKRSFPLFEGVALQ